MGDKPFEASDPDFIKRCLSSESPLGLVDRAARSLDRKSLLNATEGFDTFTHSRVFSALGETETAKAGYLRILEESQDMSLRGKTLYNLAADSKDPDEREKYHKEAIETGWPDAYAAYGNYLFSRRRDAEANIVLRVGISRGADLCLPVMGLIISQTVPTGEQRKIIEEIALLASQNGINIDRAFERWDERIIGRKGNGEIVNILRVSRDSRRLFKGCLDL